MEIKNEQNMEASILEAAELLFLEKGFSATSTTQIAKTVGCNQALVHYYFRTKENLFNSIFEQKFKVFFQKIFEVEHLEELTFEEKIKYIIDSHFQMLYANPQMPMLIITELSRRPEQIIVLRDKLKALPEKLLLLLNDELQLEINAGRVREITLADLMFSILSLNISLFILMPIASAIVGMDEEQKKFVVNHRKEENINLIMKSLRP